MIKNLTIRLEASDIIKLGDKPADEAAGLIEKALNKGGKGA